MVLAEMQVFLNIISCLQQSPPFTKENNSDTGEAHNNVVLEVAEVQLNLSPRAELIDNRSDICRFAM
jgi:hypothetical protein